MSFVIVMEVLAVPRSGFQVADLAAPELAAPTHDPAAQPRAVAARRRDNYLLKVIPWVSSRPRNSTESTSDTITTNGSSRSKYLTNATLLFWRRTKNPRIPRITDHAPVQETADPVIAPTNLPAVTADDDPAPLATISNTDSHVVTVHEPVVPLTIHGAPGAPPNEPSPATCVVPTSDWTTSQAPITENAPLAPVDELQPTTSAQTSHFQTIANDADTILELPNSSRLCKLQKGVLVGKLYELSPPERLLSEWRQIVRPQLVTNLMAVSASLPRTLSKAEARIEPEFCMSGSHVSGRPNVELRPTIWIRCGSKTCRKAVQEAVEKLSHAHSFPFLVTVPASRPAAFSQERLRFHGGTDLLPEEPVTGDEITTIDATSSTMSTGMEDWTHTVGNSTFEFKVQSISRGRSLTCGLQAYLCTSNGSAYTFTVGGWLLLDGVLLGLTTAHAIWDSALYSGDASSSSSASEKHLIYGPTYTHVKAPFAAKDPSWRSAALRVASYGSKPAAPSESGSSGKPQNCDFALLRVDVGKDMMVNNVYRTPGGVQRVRNISHNLSGRAVKLLCSPHDVRAGQLLNGDFIIVDKGHCWETRKIQLEKPLGKPHK